MEVPLSCFWGKGDEFGKSRRLLSPDDSIPPALELAKRKQSILVRYHHHHTTGFNVRGSAEGVLGLKEVISSLRKRNVNAHLTGEEMVWATEILLLSLA